MLGVAKKTLIQVTVHFILPPYFFLLSPPPPLTREENSKGRIFVYICSGRLFCLEIVWS